MAPLRRQAGVERRRRGLRRAARGGARARLRRGRRAPRGGDEVVIVTSGAIARGMRVMELPVAAAAIEDLQAASAVGQGKLFRVYDELLRERGVTQRAGAADVLRHERPHPLPQRPPDAAPAAGLARRAGHQRERHDDDRRDLLRRQRLPRRAGGDPHRRRPARPAHRHRRPLHRRPARRPGRPRLVTEVADFEALEALEIGHSTSPLGSGGMRSKVVAAEMATAAGIPAVDLQRPAARRARGGARRRRARDGHALPGARGALLELQALAAATPSPRTARSSSTPARRARCARAGRRCCRSASSTCAAGSTPATPCTSREGAGVVGKGISNYSARRAAAGQGAEERPGARAAAARHRGGRAPRLLRPRLAVRRRARRVPPSLRGMAATAHSVADRCLAAREAARVLATLDTRHEERRAARHRRRARGAHARDPRGQRARHGGRARATACPRALLDRLALDEARVARHRRRRARRSRRCPIRSARSSTASGSPTASTCARCASRSASSPSSTRRGRTSRSTRPRCA